VSLAVLSLGSSLPSGWAEELLIYSYKASAGDRYAIYTQMPGVADQRTPLISMEGDAWCPRVSPAGTQVAFVEKTSGSIYVAGIDGSGITTLGNTVPASALGWSSDGAQVYFWGAADRANPHAFYSIPVTGGSTTSLFGGQTYWTWFYDGGFEVFQGTDPATGQVADHVMFGANQTGQDGGKCDLLQLPVGTAAATPTVVFQELGDIYTPSRNRVTGQVIFQADHDRRGSHAVYALEADGSNRVLTDLYSGSPAWSYDTSTATPSADRYVYIHAGVSTFGQTAYQGTLYIVEASGTATVLNTSGTAACPSFYNAP